MHHLMIFALGSRDNYAFCASYRNKYKDIVAKITDMFNNTKLIMKENMLESDRIFTVLCRVCEDIDKISQEMKLERKMALLFPTLR